MVLTAIGLIGSVEPEAGRTPLGDHDRPLHRRRRDRGRGSRNRRRGGERIAAACRCRGDHDGGRGRRSSRGRLGRPSWNAHMRRRRRRRRLGGFRHHGGGAAARCLVDMLLDQRTHARVARAGRAAAQHHRHEVAVVAMHRGHEIESGGAGVAGLDAVDALHPAEQVIVIADLLAVPGEGRGREIAVVAREALLDGAAEQRLVARGGDLVVVGQSRRVEIGRAAHAERARLAGHHLGEGLLVAADRFRDHDGGVVRRARDEAADRVLDLDALARPQAELGRRLLGGVLGHRHHGRELHLAGVEALEQQIKRHDLGERRRMTQAVGVLLIECLAGIRVDHDRGEGRAVAALTDRVVTDAVADAMRVVMAAATIVPAVTTRIGRVRGDGENRDHCTQTQDRKTESPRYPTLYSEHGLPWSVARLSAPCAGLPRDCSRITPRLD